MDESMAAQEHVALARSLVDLHNSRQSDPAWLDKSMAAFAADATITDGPTGRTLRGPDGYKRFIRFFTESFPDMRQELTNVVATQDQVVLEGTFRWTNTGSRNLSTGALPATGHSGEVRACHVLQIRNGKIISLRCYYDMTSLLENFGLAPATAEATHMYGKRSERMKRSGLQRDFRGEGGE